jgi:hypothetical protein
MFAPYMAAWAAVWPDPQPDYLCVRVLEQNNTRGAVHDERGGDMGRRTERLASCTAGPGGARLDGRRSASRVNRL